MRHTETARIAGFNLRRLRLEKGLTQKDLAKKAKVTRETVARLELAVFKDPSSGTLQKLAVALEVTLNDLVTTA